MDLFDHVLFYDLTLRSLIIVFQVLNSGLTTLLELMKVKAFLGFSSIPFQSKRFLGCQIWFWSINLTSKCPKRGRVCEGSVNML